MKGKVGLATGTFNITQSSNVVFPTSRPSVIELSRGTVTIYDRLPDNTHVFIGNTLIDKGSLNLKGPLIMEPDNNGGAIFTGLEGVETNRYLQLLNSPSFDSAFGLKVGGVLISDSYSFANPGKNDLVVKGNVGIGTNNTGGYKLAVDGNIKAKEVKVTNDGWADYVFEPTYSLRPLTEVESFIKENKHLPEVPSAEEVKKDGVDLGKMDATLLKKIEELTLYMIQMEKENVALRERVKALEAKSTGGN